MLKDRHFTMNGCQIVNFCDTVEHFFEKIALQIKKYQFFYKIFNKRHVNVSKIKTSKMTKQYIQQAVFHKENVYITYISDCSFFFCIHYTYE